MRKKSLASTGILSALRVSTLFFLLFCFDEIVTMAQDSCVSPLVHTTGAEILERGELLLDAQMCYRDIHYSFGSYDNSTWIDGSDCGIAGALRWGIGHKTEVSFGLVGRLVSISDNSAFRSNYGVFNPAFGIRLNLFEGKRWIPQVTYRTDMSFEVMKDWTMVEVNPLMFEFRNRIGRSFLLDYSIGMNIRTCPGVHYSDKTVHYSIFARWLPSERWMLGAGIDNYSSLAYFSLTHGLSDLIVGDRNGRICLEARWLATPDLQLSLRGVHKYEKSWLAPSEPRNEVMVGLQWMLRKKGPKRR